MKELKPKFMLTRVYDDGAHDEPEIAPLRIIDSAGNPGRFRTESLILRPIRADSEQNH
ncbi:MAG: hypothetical protein LBS43_02935 [Prevotellaceae bacterium]|jgi:hypothetical protein|nr:hypothetical protein [Prevotellaceae bacterium]